ncbi:Hypothetical protein, putative [Bodo saltans]|uniref:Right handed beta helix domain-containing protein n=1 Tax=Bodo saltans TaxID=75058 RepID=A0A0S4JSA4_BODSA|nr:Hypothetical protein, putative [Bodo saltans]|eukprot:CUG93161.1 Hypothetical protein, putative [Bodo saltans]
MISRNVPYSSRTTLATCSSCCTAVGVVKKDAPAVRYNNNNYYPFLGDEWGVSWGLLPLLRLARLLLTSTHRAILKWCCQNRLEGLEVPPCRAEEAWTLPLPPCSVPQTVREHRSHMCITVLQTLLASMAQVDPTEMFLSEEWMGEGGMPPHVARGGVDDMLATILRDVSRFKSLAAEFVEECGPMIDMIDATRPDARRSELESAASRTVVMESHEEEPSLVEGSIVILPPHRSTLGRGDTCVITKRLASLSLSPLAKVVLHPGVYTERVALSEGSTVELRGSYVGASITLQQFRSHLEDHDDEQEAPIISLESGSTIRCYGMRFESTDTAAASTSSPSAAGYNGGGGDGGEPLIRVSGAGCSAEFVNCVFDRTSIGVFVEGVGATARFVDCTFRHCSYAGIYAKHGSHVVLEGCTFTRNGSSLRCRAATFSLSRCIVKQSTSDALITHGTVEGVVEDCAFEEGPENGMLVSPSTALSIHSTRVSAFRMFGVYAAKGSDVKLLHCTFLDNGLGSLNTSVPGHHRV